MGDDTSAGRSIIDPSQDRVASRRAAGAQFAAAVSEALAVGFAQSLAHQLAKLTLSDGPWLLHADGRVTEPAERRAQQLAALVPELYRYLLGEYDTADDEDWRAVVRPLLDRAADLLDAR